MEAVQEGYAGNVPKVKHPAVVLMDHVLRGGRQTDTQTHRYAVTWPLNVTAKEALTKTPIERYIERHIHTLIIYIHTDIDT